MWDARLRRIMRTPAFLAVALFLAGCTLPEPAPGQEPAGPIVLDLAGGSVSRSFDVAEGVAQVRAEVRAEPATDRAWEAALVAPGGSEARCETPAGGAGEPCVLTLSGEAGAWTLRGSASGDVRLVANLTFG